jgi:hypothetical protein
MIIKQKKNETASPGSPLSIGIRSQRSFIGNQGNVDKNKEICRKAFYVSIVLTFGIHLMRFIVIQYDSANLD